MRARLPGRARGDRRARVRRGRAAARRASSTSCPAWGRRSPGRGRCSRSAARTLLDATLGAALKVREDIERVRARGGARGCLSAAVVADRLVDAGRLRGCAADGVRRGAGRAAGRATGRWPRSTPPSRAEAYFALRAALCSRARRPAALRRRVRRGVRPRAGTTPLDLIARPAAQRGAAAHRRPGARPAPGAEPGRDRSRCPAAWSDVELLRDKDFADYTRRRARGGARGCSRGWPAAGRRGAQPRGRGRSRRRGDRADLRARSARRCATAASRSSGAGAQPRRARARSCSCCDVSGSMEPYARMLLQYMQACVAARAARGGVRVRHPADARSRASSRGRDPDARAAPRAAAAVAGLVAAARGSARRSATLNREHGRRVGRGAVVVMLSRRLGPRRPEQLGGRDGAAARAARTA